MDRKWPGTRYIPYFQAHTNTYAPLPVLREKFEQALCFPTRWGLPLPPAPTASATRSRITWASLPAAPIWRWSWGCRPSTTPPASGSTRCHSYADFLTGYHKLQKRGINVCVHIIDGLPGETHEMMLQTAQALSQLQLHSIKIHLLHLLKGTRMAEEYAAGNLRCSPGRNMCRSSATSWSYCRPSLSSSG